MRAAPDTRAHAAGASKLEGPDAGAIEGGGQIEGGQIEGGRGARGGGTARREETLDDGTVVAVEVRGGGDVAKLAAAGLRAACPEVARERGRAALGTRAGRGHIVGQSAPMAKLFALLDRVATSDATVLVTGENGTGKELVARTIHERSKRAHRRFVATNCSAFVDNLLESELFGHKRGAFTGAIADKPGLFEIADGGTFLLDEVGDMSPALQVKLLRVLQEGVFIPVGATEQKRVDVRIVAATNRDLPQMVSKGTFREDLYYRLHVVHLRVPPLRERRDDIPPLVEHFLAIQAARAGRTKTLDHGLMDRLVAHRWPGNVRELENEIERVWVLSGDAAVIDAEQLSPQVAAATRGTSGEVRTAADAAPLPKLADALAALERDLLREALERHGGRPSPAADALGLTKRALIKKASTCGLDDAVREDDP